MDNNSRTDWAGKICPICKNGRLLNDDVEFLMNTVECFGCGAILPRFTSEDVENGYEGLGE